MTVDPIAQYKLFEKYWKKARDEQNSSDYKTADGLRKKLITVIEPLISDESKIEISTIFEKFTDFVFDGLAFENVTSNSTGINPTDLKQMAEKAIELNADSFVGCYYLSFYSSMNIVHLSAGKSPAVHKGRDVAETIVGTAFSLIGKGIVLGATAAGAGITKNTFQSNVRQMVACYKNALDVPKPSLFEFLTMTPKMFHIAEICEDQGNSLWREIYSTVRGVDIANADFSDIKTDYLEEFKNQAQEYVVLADAKV